jgi:hypothetical protein
MQTPENLNIEVAYSSAKSWSQLSVSVPLPGMAVLDCQEQQDELLLWRFLTTVPFHQQMQHTPYNDMICQAGGHL